MEEILGPSMKEQWVPIMWLCVAIAVSGCHSTMHRQADYYRRVQDFESAHTLLEAAIEKHPNDADLLCQLGEVYLEQEEFESAEVAFQRCNALSSVHAGHIAQLKRTHFRRAYDAGLRELRSEDPEEAIRLLTFAGKINPAHVAVLLGLARAYVDASDPVASESTYRQVLTLDPSNVEALNNLSELTLRREEYPQAIQYAESLLAQGDDTYRSDALQRLVYAHLAGRDVIRAESAYLLIQEPSRSIQHDYAVSLFKQRQYAQAIPVLEQLALDDDGGNYSRLLGEAHLALHQYQSMVDVFSRLTHRFSDDPNVHLNLVLAYEMLGEREQADLQRIVLESLAKPSVSRP